jgi:hypothetical protein
MITKRRTLSDKITRTMESRSISGTFNDQTNPVQLETPKDPLKMQKKTKGYKSNIVSIRFDEGDYERLKEIAQEQGTNGAALVRKAVKDIIKAADTH